MPILKSLEIRNYRSIEGPLSARVPSHAPLVLIGENNAGKSNIVRALGMVLGQGWTGNHDPEDHEFYGRDRNAEIEIIASFDPEDPLDGWYTEAIWSFNMEKAGEAALRVAPSRKENFRTDYLSNEVKSSCICVVIEADRQLGYHLGYASKYTLLSRLMHEFHKALVDDRDVKRNLEGLFEQVKERFERIQPYARFAETLKEQLGAFAGPMSHRLEVDFQAYNPVNFFHALHLHATDGTSPRTLEELGTGEQQILALSFAYAYGLACHRGLVLVVEEPESHLHPLAQQWLARRIGEMCGEGLQVVLTTHSAHFIDVMNLEGLALVRKSDGGTTVAQITRADLVRRCVETGAPSGRTTQENILPYYRSMATPEILEGFFAKVVVLVEGPSEALALPVYLQKFDVVAAREGIAIVSVGGKGNLAKWRRLFEGYGIPTYLVFDNDGQRDDRDGRKRSDALRALGVPDGEHERILAAQDWSVERSYMVFGQNFEVALRGVLDGYEEQEEAAAAAGVEAKPFVARWVAEHLAARASPGWTRMREFATALRALVPPTTTPPAAVASRESRSVVARPAAPRPE